jgi:invasion protein IalB
VYLEVKTLIMKSYKFGICGFAAFGTILNASAQQPVIKSRHGAWNIQCQGARNQTVNAADLIKELEDNKKKDGKADKSKAIQQCGMVQTVKSKDRPNVGLSIIIFRTLRKDKSPGGMLRVLAPSGVFLPNGLAMEIDGKALGRIGFLRCLPNGCIAQAELTKKLMKTLRTGKKANFIIYEAPGRGLALGVLLKGFSAAYKALKS